MAGLSALAMVATVLTMPILGSPSSAAETKPNIDDADYDLIGDPALDAYFPNIRVHLRDAGVRLTNLHVTTPLCGPSRVSLLRGQYAHNTGVLANSAESGYPGGFGVSYDNGYSSDDLSIWMQRSGYTTMLVGKYLHKDFPDASGGGTYVPPGWDEFYATLGGRYYDFLQLINGRRVRRASNYPAGFRTDIERNQALALLREHTDDGPMFIDGRPTRSPLLIAGSASDDTGVAAVEVIVRSRQNSRYRSGVGFQVDFATVSATLDAPGAAFTNFGLTVTPPNIDLDVIARATDLDGTTDPLVDAALQQRIGDFFDPDTSLTTPTRGDTIIGDLTIAGTATDDVGVDHVFIVIKNTDDNTYWDGWGSRPATWCMGDTASALLLSV